MLSYFEKHTVQKALFFASRKHRSQTIGSNPDLIVPYATHFFGVALNSLNFTFNENVNRTLLLTVALLHDTLEDTDATYEELEKEFGKPVADGVLALSRDENLPKQEQIPDCIKRIKLQPKEIAIVKMADRLFNIRERFLEWTKEKQDFYQKEAQLICNELGYASPNMKEALQTGIDEY